LFFLYKLKDVRKSRNGMDSTPMHSPNKRNKIKEIICRKYFRGPSSDIMHEQHSQMALMKFFKMERIDGGVNSGFLEI
jgi:hypothetical protein